MTRLTDVTMSARSDGAVPRLIARSASASLRMSSVSAIGGGLRLRLPLRRGLPRRRLRLERKPLVLDLRGDVGRHLELVAGRDRDGRLRDELADVDEAN